MIILSALMPTFRVESMIVLLKCLDVEHVILKCDNCELPNDSNTYETVFCESILGGRKVEYDLFMKGSDIFKVDVKGSSRFK